MKFACVIWVGTLSLLSSSFSTTAELLCAQTVIDTVWSVMTFVSLPCLKFAVVIEACVHLNHVCVLWLPVRAGVALSENSTLFTAEWCHASVSHICYKLELFLFTYCFVSVSGQYFIAFALEMPTLHSYKHRSLFSLLLSRNKRNWFETLTRCAECS